MQSLPDGLHSFLLTLASKKIHLSFDGESLSVKGKISLLDDGARNYLRENKHEIIRYLSAHTSSAGASQLQSLVPDVENRFKPFPLSEVQRAYWIGRSHAVQFGGVSTHYYYELECDDIDLIRLEIAFRKVIDRHDMMRAVVNEEGTQKIYDNVPPFNIKKYDFSDLADSELNEALNKIRSEMSHQVLDSESWPIYDIRAAIKAERKLRLYFSWDFINLDAWSLYQICNEWKHFYENPESSLGPIRLSYRDYILYENKLRESEEYQKAKAYWLNKIDRLPPAPELPVILSQEANSETRFERRKLRLEKSLWNKLKSRASQIGLTPSCMLLGVFAEIIGHWSRNQHFSLNITFFNRLPIHEDVNKIVGDFTSLTLLEIDQRIDKPFDVRLKELQKQFLRDFDQRLYSGVEVMREWAKRNNRSMQATMPIVFTSCLVLDSTGEQNAGLAETFGKMVYGISQTPQVWLDNQIMEDAQGLFIHWDTLEKIFYPGSLDSMFDVYSRFLELLANDEAVWSCSRPLLNLVKATLPCEATDTQNTTEQFPELLHEDFVFQAYQNPKRPALISCSKELSYAELLGSALKLSEALKDLGVQNGDVIALDLERGWQQIVSVFGVLLAGGAFLPLDAHMPEGRKELLLRESGARLLVRNTKQRSQCETLCWDFEISDELPDQIPNLVQQPEHLAYVIFTSGSTGVPKGVMIDHRGAINTVKHINKMFKANSSDRILNVSSLSFDLSIYDIFGLLAVGGSVVIPDANQDRDPEHWYQLVETHKVSIWNSAPSLMSMLLSYIDGFGRTGLETIRVSFLSGDWIPLDTLKKIKSCLPGSELISLGGATEASIWSIYFPVREIDKAWKSIPYGKALPNQSMQVLNSLLEPTPINVVGRIYIGGIGLALGYLHDDQRTRERFIKHPVTGQRFYDTGDLGRLMPDGNIEFLGREDSQIKLRGHRIELGEIEAQLTAIQGIESCVVTTIGEGDDTRELVAFCTCQKETENNPMLLELVAHEGLGRERLENTIKMADSFIQRYVEENHSKLKNFERFWRLLEMRCIEVMRSTLYKLSEGKVFSPESLVESKSISPEFRVLVGQWVKLLIKNEFLMIAKPDQGSDVNQEQYVFTNKSYSINLKAELENAIDKLDHASQVMASYFDTSFFNQTALLRGEVKAVELLFPENGDIRIAESLYQYNPISMLHNKTIAGVISGMLEGWPEEKPLRILEVGAGTGSATNEILRVLPKTNTVYNFTDITNFFMAKARSKYSDYDFIQYNTLDINQEPRMQGIARHSYDFIVASNVLHDAHNLNYTLENLMELLTPGGKLIALEGTVNTAVQMVSVGYLEGFGAYQDERLEKNLPLLSIAQWENVFRRAGFVSSYNLPKQAPVDAYVQHIFIAETPSKSYEFDSAGARDVLLRNLPTYMVPQAVICLDNIPVTDNGKVDYKKLKSLASSKSASSLEIVNPENDLETKILNIWKEVLCKQNLSVTGNFFDLGGDSLLLVQLRSKIQKELGVNISTTSLFEHPTIRDLAQLLQSEPGSSENLDKSRRQGDRQRAALARSRSRKEKEAGCVAE